MDVKAEQARRHHQAAAEARTTARQHVQERDRLIRQLRAEDPKFWTYSLLAKAVSCSPELIAQIVKEGSSQ